MSQPSTATATARETVIRSEGATDHRQGSDWRRRRRERVGVVWRRSIRDSIEMSLYASPAGPPACEHRSPDVMCSWTRHYPLLRSSVATAGHRLNTTASCGARHSFRTSPLSNYTITAAKREASRGAAADRPGSCRDMWPVSSSPPLPSNVVAVKAPSTTVIVAVVGRLNSN
jgi:hypothetical protein